MDNARDYHHRGLISITTFNTVQELIFHLEGNGFQNVSASLSNQNDVRVRFGSKNFWCNITEGTISVEVWPVAGGGITWEYSFTSVPPALSFIMSA